MSITGLQCRMARAALGWTVKETATQAHVGINTIARFESGGEAYVSTANALQKTFEAAGIEFVGGGASSTNGVGVHLLDAA